MIFAATEAIPFTVAVSEFAKEESTFDVIDVVVAATPLTVEVMMLPDVVARFVVPAAIAADRLVDVATPLTVEVSTVPDVERSFELTAAVFEDTPFTFEVIVFPDDEMVLLPMTLLVAETPLIVVVKMLPESD